MEGAEGPFVHSTSPRPHYKLEAPLQFHKPKAPTQVKGYIYIFLSGPLYMHFQVQGLTTNPSPKAGYLNWKGPKVPSLQHKSKATTQVQGHTTNSRLHYSSTAPKEVAYIEGAEGHFAPIQDQGHTANARFHYNSTAPKEAVQIGRGRRSLRSNTSPNPNTVQRLYLCIPYSCLALCTCILKSEASLQIRVKLGCGWCPVHRCLGGPDGDQWFRGEKIAALRAVRM